jgi:hypothetical protein
MYMFTTLYLHTTDPRIPWQEWPLRALVASIVFHTVVYAAFFNLASFVFYGHALRLDVNARLVVALLVIMTFGFLARFQHVQEIYRAFNHDLLKTRKHCDHVFLTWFFMS